MRYEDIGCLCSACPFRPAQGSPLVRKATDKPLVIAVAESPRSFGKMWSKALEVTGVPRARVATFALIHCKPETTATKLEYEAAAEACVPGALEEIRRYAAEHPTAWIFAQGGPALKFMAGKTNINKWLGGPLPTTLGGCTNQVLGSFEPSFLQTPGGKSRTPIWLRHLSWVYGLAAGTLPPWKWPDIYIDWNPACAAALDRIEAASSKGADIETSGIEKDSTIRCIGFSADGVAVCLPWDPIADYHPQILRILRGDKTLIWQNGGFDRGMLRHWGVKLGPNHEDLMLIHAIARPQEFHGLGFIAGAETWAESHKARFHSEKDDY